MRGALQHQLAAPSKLADSLEKHGQHDAVQIGRVEQLNLASPLHSKVASQASCIDLVEILANSCGDQQRALQALQRTKQYSDCPRRWVEEAGLWLAEEARQEVERKALADAMATSLREEEERRAAERPLQEWSPSRLLSRFQDSTILNQVASAATLFSLPVREEVIGILEFERQACKWFPGSGTRAFFRSAMETALQESCMDNRLRQHARQKCPRRQPRQAAQECCARSQEEVLLRIVSTLQGKVQAAKTEVFKMPKTDNQVPAIFAILEEEQADDSDVEVVAEPLSEAHSVFVLQ